jgi:hypothetical protein
MIRFISWWWCAFVVMFSGSVMFLLPLLLFRFRSIRCVFLRSLKSATIVQCAYRHTSASRFLTSPCSVLVAAFATDGEGFTAEVSAAGDIRRGDPKGVVLAPDAQLRMYWGRDQLDWLLFD